MANRVSNEQLEELLDFLVDHPAIAKGVGLGVRSKETIEKHWNDIDIKLNSHGSGSSKSGERWKKYWADLKHKSKSRLVKRRWDTLRTGGGLSRLDNLSEIDQKILAVIGEQVVFGDVEHRVPPFNPDTANGRVVSVNGTDISVIGRKWRCAHPANTTAVLLSLLEAR